MTQIVSFGAFYWTEECACVVCICTSLNHGATKDLVRLESESGTCFVSCVREKERLCFSLIGAIERICFLNDISSSNHFINRRHISE